MPAIVTMYSDPTGGACVGRFVFNKQETTQKAEVKLFCEWVCEQMFFADGNIKLLSKEVAKEMIFKADEIQKWMDDKIDVSYLEIWKN